MDRYIAPPRCRLWSRNDMHVYFDPYNFSWIKVNDNGRVLMEMFREYMAVDEITEEISHTFGVRSADAEEAIRRFGDRLVAAKFLHRNEYCESKRHSFGAVSFPGDVYVHLTNKCNLKCPYCYNKTDRQTKIKLEKAGLVSPTMSTVEFKELIGKLVYHGVDRILFTGGEPLLRDDALELVKFARSLSDAKKQSGEQAVVLEMLTNATRINDSTAEEMCRYLDRVTISLDGHERHLHEDQRGAHTFVPTIRGIRQLAQKKKELDSKLPLITIVPALTDKNIGFMRDMYEFCLDDLGANNLAPLLFQAGDHQELSIMRIPKLDIYLEAQEQTDRYLEERRIARGMVPAKKRIVSPRNQCGVGNGEISVDPGGFVYPCQSLHFDEFICGNVRETDIKTIFDQSAVMQRTRGTTVDRLAVCSHCDVKHLCSGGCRATAYNIYREFDRHNELYCNTLEAMAVRTLWRSEYSDPELKC
jgi:radical SAM protein with 4Fe4S-binding SPASM domain